MGVGLALGLFVATFAYSRWTDEPEKHFCAGVGATESFTGSRAKEVVSEFVLAHGGDPAKAKVSHRYGGSGDSIWDVLSTGIDLNFESIVVVADAGGMFKYDGACVHLGNYLSTTSS